VFAIGILPYITASIIVQMLTQVIPRLERLRKEGKAGQATITQYTRYVAVGLGLLYAVAYVQAARTDAVFSGSDLQLSGVSLLIMVGVGLDTVKQIQPA